MARPIASVGGGTLEVPLLTSSAAASPSDRDPRRFDLRRIDAAVVCERCAGKQPRHAPGPIQTNSNPLWIGGNSPYGEYFQGLIDEVRIYSRALSVTEIQTGMNTPIRTRQARTDSAGLGTRPLSDQPRVKRGGRLPFEQVCRILDVWRACLRHPPPGPQLAR